MSESEALYPLSLRSGARRAMEAMDGSKKSREEVIEPGVMETPPGDESAAQYPKRLRGDDSPAMDGNKKAGEMIEPGELEPLLSLFEPGVMEPQPDDGRPSASGVIVPQPDDADGRPAAEGNKNPGEENVQQL